MLRECCVLMRAETRLCSVSVCNKALRFDYHILFRLNGPWLFPMRYSLLARTPRPPRAPRTTGAPWLSGGRSHPGGSSPGVQRDDQRYPSSSSRRSQHSTLVYKTVFSCFCVFWNDVMKKQSEGSPLRWRLMDLCLFPHHRGHGEEGHGVGAPEQPQPGAPGPAHAGRDDLVPADRGGLPLQAQRPRGGGQEDAGGAPELPDGTRVVLTRNDNGKT